MNKQLLTLALAACSLFATAQNRALSKASVNNQLIGRSGIVRTNLGAKYPTIPIGVQATFSETFDGIAGPTAGGAGTYVFPSNFTLFNVDGLTSAAAVSWVNDAWERREDYANAVTDSAAFSTSWYSPAGSSNDWMVTPAITGVTANTMLAWNAVTYDPAYPDGYEVRVFTTAPTVGNLMSSTVLFTIGAENSTWTPRLQSLAAYAGQTIYIAYRNNSNDKFLLLIDDISVYEAASSDVAMGVVDTLTEYTAIPNPQVHPINFAANITNLGTSNEPSVSLKVDVYNPSNTVVYTNTSATAALNVSATGTFSCTPYTPVSGPGMYKVLYTATLPVADGVPTNDTTTRYFYISDSTYMRDDNTVVGGLGIGAGNGGYLGNQYTLYANDVLTSITVYYNRGYTGKEHAVAIFDHAAGTPNNIIATTDTLLYPDNNPLTVTYQINGGPLNLNAGDYSFCAIEFDSTLQLGSTASIFTAGKMWVNWPTSPMGGWANVEAFGGSFAKPFVIRPNFGVPPSTGISSVKENNFIMFPNPAHSNVELYNLGENAKVSVLNMIGQEVVKSQVVSMNAELDLRGLNAGIYFVQVIQNNKKHIQKLIVE